MASISKTPSMPDGLIEEIKSLLKEKKCPFLNHLNKEVKLIYGKGRDATGVTRFECDHNELFRRRRLRLSPGPITMHLIQFLTEMKHCTYHSST